MAADPGHWNTAYTEKGATVSWHQTQATTSLDLIAEVATPEASVVDVGGGASTLVDGLLARGHRDITVLDLSQVALDTARDRLGERGASVTWRAGDLLAWEPGRTYDVWHDRAVLHFLIDDTDRARYAELAARAVAPGGHAIIGTFAPDGPQQCSGLPVRRHSADDLATLLADDFEPVRSEREEHRTPSGNTQPFSWLVARRAA
ncbi:MAG: class I SAM-dependent methyltransferase [Solirubrobacteraceae bacterium]